MSERNLYNIEIWCDCTMGCKKCGRENTLPIIDVQKLMDENQALLKENKRLREESRQNLFSNIQFELSNLISEAENSFNSMTQKELLNALHSIADKLYKYESQK
jgi:hypothetical protein